MKRRRAWNWSPAEDRLLGKLPDAEVARRIGRSFRAVQGRRENLRINVEPRRPWTKAEDRLVAQLMKPPRDRHGTRELAKRLGRSQAMVEARRRALFGRVLAPPHNWTRREERLLGTRTDKEVARLLGCKTCVVAGHRRRLGREGTRNRRPWTPAEERLLGTMPDGDLAGKLHRTPQEVRKRRISLGVRFREYAPAGRHWTTAEELLVGTDTDRAIARKLNRTSYSVIRKRWALGLPGFNRRKRWTEAEDRLVRTLPVRTAARRLRRTLKAVMHRRHELGLRHVRSRE